MALAMSATAGASRLSLSPLSPLSSSKTVESSSFVSFEASPLRSVCRRSRDSLSVRRDFTKPVSCSVWNGERERSGIIEASSFPEYASEFDPNAMLLRERIVFLGGQVDDNSADAIISQLLLLDAQDSTTDIKLFINSPGGSVTAGMGIYDVMKLCKADISTICFGLAASMGAFLLCAGTKGKRYCMPNARVMIHQPLGGAGGSAIDAALQVREMMYHKVKLNKIMSRLTGKDEKQMEIDTDRDYFMNAWEAVEYGLVDSVIDDGKPGLVAPIGEAKEPPKSRIWDSWTTKEGRERRDLPGESRLFTKKSL